MKNLQKFSGYELYFYGSGVKDNPQRIASLKNNKELLGACRSPKTIEQLSKLGITVSDKQIKQLHDWRLLKIKDGAMHTAITILSEEETLKLRKLTKDIAPTIVEEIKQEFNDFLQVLDKQYPSYAYVLFFSYVLDFLAWDGFIKRGVMERAEVKDKQDLWVGIVWGSYLQRPFSIGTNGYGHDAENVIVCVVWNNNLLPKLKPLFYHPEKISQLARKFNVPTIYEKPGDPVYESSQRLSEKLAEEVLHHLDLNALVKEYQFNSIEEALIVVYHELLWDIMEEMENQKLLTKPEVIAHPKQAKESDISNLVFLVKTS